MLRLLLIPLVLLAAAKPTTLLTPPFSHTLGFNRIGRFYLRMYLGAGFKVDDPQGMCGAKMIEEDDPTTGKDDHILTLFGVNSGTGQIVYNVKLIEPRIYGSAGSDTTQFRRPHGICCNPQGDVYVADTDNDRVVRLRYQDTRLNWVSVLGGDLAAPHDVDVDSRDRVYVADTDNNRIVVYNVENEPIAAWDSELEGPTGVCVIDHAADYNQYGTDHAAVIDRNRTRLSLFTLSGQLRKRIDLRRIGLAEAGFAYMAHDRHGNLYVTDQVNNRVHVFDPQLKYIVSYGSDNEINSPRGIVIWRKFGQVFLNEAEGGRYYWIGLDGYMIGFYPQEFDSRRPGTTIALYITEVADVTVTVSDNRNRTVRTLTPPHNQRPGEVLIVWDGNDDDGNLVPPGDYRVHAVIRPTYSRPKRTFKKELVGTVRRIPDN